MVIRAMSLGELEQGAASKVILKELSLGIMLGLIMGASIAAVTLFILPVFDPEIPPGVSLSTFALSVSLSLTIQIAVSTLTGALLPIGARAIKLDPAVVAAPAITTLVDGSQPSTIRWRWYGRVMGCWKAWTSCGPSSHLGLHAVSSYTSCFRYLRMSRKRCAMSRFVWISCWSCRWP